MQLRLHLPVHMKNTQHPTESDTISKLGRSFFSWVLLFTFAFPLSPLLSQDDEHLLDSLQEVLSKTKVDTQRVDLLNDIAWELKFEDPAKARDQLQQAIQLSKKVNYKKGEGQAYNNLGVVETIHDNKDEAIASYEKALVIRQGLGDKKGVASIYNNIGNLQTELDAYEEALVNFQNSLKIREELNDSQRIANVHYNLSVTNEEWGNYSEALDHIFQYLETAQQLNDQSSILNAYNVIGNIKSELELFTEAKENYEQAMTLAQELEDDWETATAYNNLGNNKDDFGERSLEEKNYADAFVKFNEAITSHQSALGLRQKMEYADEVSASYNNIGLVYKNLGTYYIELQKKDSADWALRQALNYLQKSLDIREELEDRKGIMEIYNGIGDVKRRQKKYSEAKNYATKYLAIAEELKDKKFIQNAYRDLSKAYEGKRDYKNALAYQKKYDKLRYKRLDESRTRFNSRREAIFGDRTKQLEIDKQNLEIERNETAIQRAAIQRRALIGGAIGLLILIGLLYNRYLIKNKTNKALEEKNNIIVKEQERSEALLLNILPRSTADELKEKGTAAARKYDSVSVLFTDFKSFTQATEAMPAENLVALLDQCYRAFDAICEKHGVEKIKTIGDSYMCAGGLPEENSSHATDVVKAGLEMQAFMQTINDQRVLQGQPVLEMRVGVHSGSVVAGIVGSKKFAYDIWGDTVNIAARMESSGAVGLVNVSESTYQFIKNSLKCSPRGKIAAKNKGEIDMYFVEEAAKKEVNT